MLQWIRDALAPRRGTPPEAEARFAGWLASGRAARASGDLTLAEELCRRILDAEPDHAEALLLSGEIAALRGENELAEGLLRRALAIDDAQARYHFTLGCVLQALGKGDAALLSFRQAVVLDPGFGAARTNIGCLLVARGELEEAQAELRAAAQADPQNPDTWINLGFALERSRRLEESLACYDRALAIDAALVPARFNRALVLLALGRYPEGWQEYGGRWQASGYPRPAHRQPEWDGRVLRGETVFLYTEQGFGDSIHFARYATLVAERGGHVVLRCQPELAHLLRGVPGVAETLTPERVPAFDFHCALLDLPRVFGTTVQSIPARVPYVSPDATRVREWRARLSDGRPGMKVGLAWASHSKMSNAGERSIPPDALALLARIPGVRYYSLQPGGKDAPPIALTDHTAEIRDFSDTAALIANLDLTLSIETAVAHLAGAMGAPAWTMLQRAPDWRWYPDGPTSNWYPGMRLFRQPKRGDWSGVCAQVARELGALAAATSRT